MPLRDALNRNETSLSNGGKWAALAWDTGATANKTGRDTTTGWSPIEAFSIVNGAYWTPSTFSDKSPIGLPGGDVAAITMPTSPGVERYVALWLDMSSPATAKTGYQLRWTGTAVNTYSVTLSKWSAGTQTTLASNASVTIMPGSTLAISDSAGTVTAWQGSSAGTFSSLLSAADTTFTSGYAGIEASGNVSRLTKFKAGQLAGSAFIEDPILDSFERSEVPLANGKWTKTGWAAGIGGASTGEKPGFGSSGGLEGAYWNVRNFSDTDDMLLSSATVGAGATPAAQYLALWLDMPNPSSERSGYEARFTGTNGASTAYTVELSKWVAGTRTVLASKTGFSLPVGTSITLTESAGGGLAVWTGSVLTSTPLLTASDSTYTGGYAGIEVNGSAGSLRNFRAGHVFNLPPVTSISAGPKGVPIAPASASFSFTSNPTGASFECSLDGASYSACTSPAQYSGLGEGTHTFGVRATNSNGTDETPATQSFKVVSAATATSKVAVLDNLERSEIPLANGKWTKPSWTAGIGGAWMGVYRGFGSSGGLEGAYWNPTTFSSSTETQLVAATVGTGATPAGQYLALWLDMSSPATTQSGYEARFTGTNGTSTGYTVELSQWTSGTRVVLGSTSGFSLPVGTTIALIQPAGGRPSLWAGTATTMNLVLSSTSTTYTSGYAGLEVNGGAGTLYNFRAGRTDFQPPDTTISSGPSGVVQPQEVSFTFTATEGATTFECSLDGAAYSACSSPKAYPGLISGSSHTFKVRAVDAVGNQDETPAERSFQVVSLPSAITTPATAVKPSEATLHASVNPNGVETKYQFEYGTTISYGSKSPATATSIGSGTTSVEASQPITGLQPGTTYHFRISATNAAGTRPGEDRTFTTPAAPLVTTEPATGVGRTGAMLNATVNPNGAETKYQFQYGTTTSYGSTIPATAKAIGSGSTTVSVIENLSGLSEGVTYHYRVAATNEAGTTYGADRAMTTLQLPVATTEPATGVEGIEPAVHATVNPNGQPTTYQFEYGKTASYGSLGPAGGGDSGNGTQVTAASEVLEQLESNTTYHYRVVATSPAGSVTGLDRTFTTGEAPSGEELWSHNKNTGQEGVFTSTVGGGVGENEIVAPSIDLQFGGGHEDQPAEMRAIHKMGASMLRMQLAPDGNQQTYQHVFENASKENVTILPYLYGAGGQPDVHEFPDVTHRKAYIEWVEAIVATYGPTGSFWQGNAAKAPTLWEVWNEPNVGLNNPQGKVNPEEYGRFLIEVSEAITRKSAGKAHAMVGGLLNINAKGTSEEVEMRPEVFLGKMALVPNVDKFYTALGLHPYVFKANRELDHAPRKTEEVEEVARRVTGQIKLAREALNKHNGSTKPIWITELGWPLRVVADSKHEGIECSATVKCQQIQGELINYTFDRIKEKATQFGVPAIFYFNDRDVYPENADKAGVTREWWFYCGLRTGGNYLIDPQTGAAKQPLEIEGAGKFRKATYAFEAEAGVPRWPNKAPTRTTGSAPLSRRATVYGRVAPEGLPTQYRFLYGTTSSYGQSTGLQSAGYDKEVEVNSELSGLKPNTTYHYKIISINENDEQEDGLDQQFKTELSTTIDTSIRTLNGEPGWIDVAGHVNSSEGHSLTGDYVNINFWKNEGGQFVFKPEESTHAGIMNNYYNLENWKIGKGEWQVQVVFEGFGEDLKSETPVHTITIENGYQLYNLNSGKCLEVAEKSYSNGAGIHQWDCGDPRTRQDQVFTLVPTGGGQFDYELVARHSNMCLDVIGAGQGVSTGVQQYECLGAGQTNQIWHGVPPVATKSDPVQFSAKHSGQCLDILGSATNNGANAVQNPCSGAASQKWVLVRVESNQVPLEAHITVDEELYGHPGYVTGHGNIDAGGYNLSGKWVNVNFQRLEPNGKYETVEDRTIHPTLSASGYYSFTYRALGAGEWQTRVVFPGEGPLEEDKSEYRHIHIGDGYRFEFRQSKKCLTTSENKTGNGTAIIQWDCGGGPAPWDGQVYSLVPVQPYGSAEFSIRPDTDTNKCVDVAGANPANGTYLLLWDCLGESQANQIWHIIPIQNQPPWFASIARHSGKCWDVFGQSLSNGARIDQWECYWGGNQQWRWLPIG